MDRSGFDVKEHARAVEKIALLNDVRTATRQIEAGQGVLNDDAKAELRSRLGA
jgi:hypothetical protein